MRLVVDLRMRELVIAADSVLSAIEYSEALNNWQLS